MPKKPRPAKPVGAVIPNGPSKKSPRAAKAAIVYPDYDDTFLTRAKLRDEPAIALAAASSPNTA